jgi:tripartite-type tricarboxylate transporter receptor subunit TctC
MGCLQKAMTLGLALATGAAAAAQAVEGRYPTKPIRLVVGAAPGGTPDILARIIGPKLAEQMGQPVVVDNRPGAAGNVGADVLAKAPKDGYTIMIGTAPLAISPSYYRKLPYDSLKDLAPVTLLASQALFLFVHAESPLKSVKDLIAAAKAKPGAIGYASFGSGSPHHLVAELMQIATGTRFIHVPYKSGGLMVTALLSREVQFMFLGISPVLPHVKAGRVRTVAVASAKRSATAPDVPTFAEAGVPGVVVDNWLSFFTTGGTPRTIVDRLSAEIVRAVKTPDVADRVAEQGVEIVASTPAEFAAFFRAEIGKFAKIVQSAGIERQ